MGKSLVLLVMYTFLTLSSSAYAAPKCVQVYYDEAPQAEKKFWHGKIHAMFLQNLLGHFKNVEQKIIPIENYKSGDIERCFSSIYIGSYFENKIPASFYSDFVNTKKNVAWLGYNMWKLGNQNLNKMWGVNYNSITKLDRSKLDENGFPGFYRFYSYKGEEFFKYATYQNPEDPKSRFHAAFEIIKLDLVNAAAKKNVISWASHSTKNSTIPYILANKNHWYVGDSPFSYMTEEDRYMIFSDILFDILDEEPIYKGKKPALFRVEDVHARVPAWQINGMINLLKKHEIPFSMSMIPIFTDPFGRLSDLTDNQFMPLSWDTNFVDIIDHAANSGASFIYHGVTHQSGNRKNPFNGISGDDFEFWDKVANKPIQGDSPEFVINRLEDGLSILEDAHIKPVAWLTPHYQASPLDYIIFSQLFSWNVGRIIYFPYTTKNFNSMPSALTMDNDGVSGNGQRLAYFEGLEVDFPDGLSPNGQFFPYEIYSDIYGQRIIPENVGNVQPYMNEQVFQVQTVKDLIRILKRNRVLRDVWGSFFVHSFRLDTVDNGGVGSFAGDSEAIESLLIAAKKYNYEFIDLKSFVAKNKNQKKIKVTVEKLK